MKYQQAKDQRCPTPLQLTYSKRLKEVVYPLEPTNENEYETSSRKYKQVKFSNYKLAGYWNPSKFVPLTDPEYKDKPYAFGYLIDPFKSNLLVIDIDDNNESHLKAILENFAKEDFVKEMDVAGSSFDKDDTTKILRYHVYIGLDKEYNILDFYKLAIPGACSSYAKYVLTKEEVVIRVSRKFNMMKNKTIDTNIRWQFGYSRKENDIWLGYSSEQLIAPLTTVDGPSSNEIQGLTRPRLKLRG